MIKEATWSKSIDAGMNEEHTHAWELKQTPYYFEVYVDGDLRCTTDSRREAYNELNAIWEEEYDD